MRYMGLDIGKKRIGVAVSDESGLVSTPHVVVKAGPGAIDEIIATAEEFEVRKIVVGMPIKMDGTIGEMGEYVQAFIKKLSGRCSLEIATWDERLSTSATTKVLIDAGVSRAKRKLVVDKLSAAYILQGYLDAKRG